ncbi:MAG: hypothetical protein DHS20C21_07750 [Gemmatimonadota bacterium]|nr:MAG: hypothetical protein DHS20C21_07750 [Gemmatimonadota bacterium]
MTRRFAYVSLCWFLACALFTSAEARTWVVNSEGTGDAPTLQAAVDSTAVGDTIFVSAGDYEGPVILKQGTHLVGEPPAGSASITGPFNSDLVVSVVSGTVARLELGGVFGTGYGNPPRVISSEDSIVEDCILRASHFAVLGSGSLTLADCEIRATNGVRVEGDRLEIFRCTFEIQFASETPVGIQPQWPDPAALVVSDCVFRRNGSSSSQNEPTLGWGFGTIHAI